MLLAASFTLFAVLSCTKPDAGTKKPGTEEPGKEDVLFPEAPEQVIVENLFHVDFVTDLADAPYMKDRKTDDVITFIKSRSGKKPLVYMIDRMDFEVGKVNPSVLAARDLSMSPFFAQCRRTTENKIPGTAILTLYPISDYDGTVLEMDNFISGCKLRAPLQQPEELTFYTSRFETFGQVKSMFRAKATRLQKNSIVTGTVRKEAAPEMKEFAEKEIGCRLEIIEGKDTEYDFFAMIPAAFVFRGVTLEKSGDNIGYFHVSIEKLV